MKDLEILDMIAALPSWERADFVRELIPVLNLDRRELMEAVLEWDRYKMDNELMAMNKGAFLRLYMDEHDGEVNLVEEIAQRREIEWEDPYTYNCRP